MKYLDAPTLMRKYNIRPQKSLGQNFLIESAGLDKVIQAAQLQPTDFVLEIGAGLGSLTVLLAQIAGHVTAVEIDQNLLPALTEAAQPYPNISVIPGDILEQDLSQLISDQAYLVVANIPYYITSAILRHLLEAGNKPKRMVLTIQKEVARRVLAKDGKHSLLSLSVQVYGKPSLHSVIPAGSFFPKPDVDSAVLIIDLYEKPLIPFNALERFFILAHAGFSQKRKTLRNSLSAGLRIPVSKVEVLLAQTHIDPSRRAETLTLAEWQGLIDAFNSEASATNQP